MLIRRTWSLARPSDPLVVNGGSSQAHGLGAAFMPLPSGAYRDLVSGRITSAAAPRASAFGIAGYFGNDPTSIDLTPYSEHGGTGKTWTMRVFLLSAGADQDYQAVLTFGKVGGGSQAYGPYISVGGGTLNVYSGEGGAWTRQGTIAPLQWVDIAVTLEAGGAGMFVNGVRVGTSGALTYGALVDTARVGDRADGVFTSFDGLITDIRRYDRILSGQQIAALSNPHTRWELYAPQVARRLFLDRPNTAGDTSLSGALIARGTVAAGLTTSIPLAAAATSRCSVAAALTTSIAAAAALTARATVSGGLSTNIAPAAAVTGRGTVTAGLTTSLPLASAIVGRGSVSADLTAGSVGLDAAVTGRANVTAALTTAISFASALQARATVTAGLTAPGSGLTTTLQGRATVTASLTTGIAASAALVARGSVAGALQTSIPLASVQAGRAAVAAQLTTSVALAAAPMARVALTAGLTTGIPLGAQLAARATATGTLTVPSPYAYEGLRLAAARAGKASITARAGRASITARTHLSE